MPPQPPKKRSAPSAASSTPKKPKARQSKLAKENDISGEEEAEIKEVFHIFSESNEDFPDEKEGVIAREDVRKALVPRPVLPQRTAVDSLGDRPHGDRVRPLRAIPVRCGGEAAVAV
ncbi:EF-hand superfamily Ca2+-modulated protein [Aspergillus mulundensis]|uniref:Uncharacterized protein n=1 Tax=Aspergillus mulundensis TaxID=1810919 RepID=A0A3D8QNZ2_9EURO|nr:hypothetical protein DSM5745_10285 [Aspergillus mulundensis]RDW63174.1 hypothetical protein DSM5745_10285 [Aspergillus mulundensis]